MIETPKLRQNRSLGNLSKLGWMAFGLYMALFSILGLDTAVTRGQCAAQD
jgi:hypothetical protein